MSRTDAMNPPVEETTSKKRSAEDAELEIDINAPEPPSKKALRKAKKRKDGDDNSASTAKAEAKSQQTDTSVLDGQDGKRSEHGIWIGNLSFTTTKQDLLNFLTGDNEHVIREDQITRIHLPMSTERKLQNKGFAYVDFNNSGSSRNALELSETLLGGRRVLIKDAKNFEGRPKTSKSDQPETPDKAPSKRIFIGNLSFDTTAEQLEEHFGVCGPIQHTHMATFEDSGKCKGYAWIEFEQLSSAAAAMRGWVETTRQASAKGSEAMGGKRKIWLRSIAGRKLRMEFAEDKATRYNKRFGKGSKSEAGEAGDGAKVEQADGIVELPDPAPPSTDVKREGRKGRRPVEKDKANSRYGYGTETVQKLKGAIVEGQGKKVVFD